MVNNPQKLELQLVVFITILFRENFTIIEIKKNQKHLPYLILKNGLIKNKSQAFQLN